MTAKKTAKKIDELHQGWLKRPGYAAAYAELAIEFEIAATLIEARARAGLTQEQLAERMHTTRTAIARLESGRSPPTTRTLDKFAKATGHRLEIRFKRDRAA